MDVSGQLHTLPSLIQVKKPGTPEPVWSFWRREKFLSLLQFWTLDHPEGGKDAVHTMTPRFPKYHPRTGHDGHPLLFYNLERKPVPILQEAGWAPGPVWSGAENLVPKLGFNPQIVPTIARHYTHVTKAYSCTLTPALDDCEQLTSCSAALIPGKNSGTPLIEGWVGLGEEKNILSLLGFEPYTMQPVEQSLYPPCYLGSQNFALDQAMKAWP